MWPCIVLPKLTKNGGVPKFSTGLIEIKEFKSLDSLLQSSRWGSNSENCRIGSYKKITEMYNMNWSWKTSYH